MKRTHTIFIILIGFQYFNLYSQIKKTLYVNEDFKEISKLEFDKKHNSSIYGTKTYDLDTIVYKSTFLRYYMGKLEKTKKKQLYSLLVQRNNVDTTKSILIHYKDTLKTIGSFPTVDSFVYYKKGGIRRIVSHNTFIKVHKDCEREYSKKHITTYHFFNHNEGHPLEIKKIIWRQDYLGLLRKLFFTSRVKNKYWTILLHPNGDYVVNYFGVAPLKKWKEFKKHKNWNTHFLQFQKSMSLLNPEAPY